MTIRQQVRHDTAANLTSTDPVLRDGELGLETDTLQFKFGDGVTVWSLLPYHGEDKKDANNGFINGSDDTTLSFDNNTRTLTVTPTGGSFSYTSNGQRYTSAVPLTYQIPDVSGGHWVFIDGETTDSEAELTDDSFLTKAHVAIVFWNSGDAAQAAVLNTRHCVDMSNATRLHDQRTLGVRYGEGLGLTNMDVDGSGNDASACQFAVDDGTVWNEDIRVDIFDGLPQDLSPLAQVPVFYRIGTEPGEWLTTAVSDFPVVTTGTGRLAWNELVSGSWQLTEVTNNRFVLVHYLATGDIFHPITGLVGGAEYNSLNDARANAALELLSLGIGDLVGLSGEIHPIATVIYQTADSYTNTPKARVRSTADGADYIDWRASGAMGVAGTSPAVVWGGISGDVVDQADLQAELDAKSDTGHTHVLADVTDSGGMAAIDDAPSDGSDYVRKDAAWAAASGGGGGVFPPVRYVLSDFYSTSSGQNLPYVGGAVASGTSNAAPATGMLDVTGISGVCLIRSSTSANSGYRWMTASLDRIAGQTDLFFRAIVGFPDDFTSKTMYLGFHDAAFTSSEPVDGTYFAVSASSTCTPKTSNTSTRTSGSTFVLTADTYYVFEIYWTSTSSINFKIKSLDEVTTHLDTDITTNIPTGTRTFGAGVIAHSSGTSVDDLVAIDYSGHGFMSRG